MYHIGGWDELVYQTNSHAVFFEKNDSFAGVKGSFGRVSVPEGSARRVSVPDIIFRRVNSQFFVIM